MFEPIREWVSPQEYLELDARADEKSEYFDGEVFAMAGGTLEHNLIVGNLIRELGNQLEERPCRVYPSDQRVKIPSTGLYTYPDVTVVCGDPHADPEDRRTLLNPVVIIEVLSETTEAYDRGDKFAHYQTLESLREYVLVASDRARIERFVRQEEGSDWVYGECGDADGVLALASIGCVLSLPRVYSKVEFPERAPGRRRGPERGWRGL